MLKRLQEDFYQDILSPNKAKNYQNSGEFTGSDLMQIYHHQYFISLIDALAKSYSCIKRLVGEDFFKFLATDFIKNHPPKTSNIIDYGEEFSAFIRHHTHCQNMPYLVDIAKFERLYEQCYFSTNAVFFMRSDYPIIKIWQLDENSATLDLSIDGDCLKIYKKDNQVIVEKIVEFRVFLNENVVEFV